MSKRDLTRRGFLRGLPAVAAGAMVWGPLSGFGEASQAASAAVAPRTRIPNPYATPDSRPILVCVEGTDFQRMLKRGMDILGGFGKLVGSDQDVVLKPNLNDLDQYPGVSTIGCLRAIVCDVLQHTAGEVCVADQGFVHNSQVYAFVGLMEAVTAAGGTVDPLNETIAVRHTSWPMEIPDSHVYSRIFNAPVLINTCCLKRHFLATMTCSLKNSVGAVTGPQATGTRSWLHSLSGAELQEGCAIIAQAVNPDFHIVDARTVLTVSGPRPSMGQAVEANRIILCGDPVATDVYAAQMLAQYDSGFDPASIDPMLSKAQSLGLGTRNLADVEIIEVTEV